MNARIERGYAATLPTPGKRVDVRTSVAVIVMHAVALAAPWTFSWIGLLLFAILAYITLVFGLIIGYHRFFTHRSFETSAAVSCAFAVVGIFALEGTPIRWAATHRLHHLSADKPKDPHTPRRGLAWAHVIWSMFFHEELCSDDEIRYWVKDLSRDQRLVWLGKRFLQMNLILGGVCLLLAYATGGWARMLSVLVWGFCLRICAVWHASWLVNSFCHRHGYRNFETPDDSTNNWFVALLTFGEGWHNNHHARPRLANFGLRTWEIDCSFLHILLMERIGLVWKVKR